MVLDKAKLSLPLATSPTISGFEAAFEEVNLNGESANNSSTPVNEYANNHIIR